MSQHVTHEHNEKRKKETWRAQKGDSDEWTVPMSKTVVFKYNLHITRGSLTKEVISLTKEVISQHLFADALFRLYPL